MPPPARAPASATGLRGLFLALLPLCVVSRLPDDLTWRSSADIESQQRYRGGTGTAFSTHQLPPSIGAVRLNLDPARYRSSSQGPVMQEETRQVGVDVSVDEAVNEIDRVIDRVVRTHGWSPVIPQYAGNRSWAWHQWRGTIIERLWKSVLWNMLVPTLLILTAKLIEPSTSLWQVPAWGHGP